MAAKYFFLLFLLVWIAEAQDVKIFNVKDYGAIADGKTDNSVAFVKAWNDTCQWKGNATTLIPKGTYMVNHVIFSGPCNGWTHFMINGILKAPTDPSIYRTSDNWINFRYVNNLVVAGGGTLDGQGSSAWAHKDDCTNIPNCSPLPTSLSFAFITNGYIHHLHSTNSKQAHFAVYGCENMKFTQIRISAPGESPNTDGIKVALSKGIDITRSNIGTGDDCIAILSGTSNVNISDVFCGPGHGISVGSLGKSEDELDVQNIFVKNCTISNTLNGVRIKTWAATLKKTLKATNFLYDDIVMDNVVYPIIIDQEYCPYRPCYNQGPSSVEISDVKYTNIRGSGNTDIGVSLKCSSNKPCQNITMDNVDLWRYGGKGKFSNWCSHANGVSYGKQNPPSCL